MRDLQATISYQIENLLRKKPLSEEEQGELIAYKAVYHLIEMRIHDIKLESSLNKILNSSTYGINTEAVNAFEIMINKRVDIGYLKECDNLDEYNKVMLYDLNDKLNKQEFNLIKEIIEKYDNRAI